MIGAAGRRNHLFSLFVGASYRVVGAGARQRRSRCLGCWCRSLRESSPQRSAPGVSATGLTGWQGAPPSGCAGARLFELLAAGPARTGTWLLPSLHALRLAGCRDVTGHEVLRVVHARGDAAASGERVSRLAYVRLAPSYPLDPEVVENLRGSVDQLRMDGQ